jgi:hypothetical protein
MSGGGYQYERRGAFGEDRCYHLAPMADFTDRIRTRILPAVLTAIGVALLAGGLLSYSNPVSADPALSASPAPSTAAVATPSPLITLPPLGSGGPPAATPPVPADRVATRVRIAALKVDLPVIKPPPGYPVCNVAMYFGDMSTPGAGRSVYLYAHARVGMFLPLLNASLVQNGKKMIGMIVEVWTSDDQRFLYEITEVRRHTLDLDDAFAAKTETLWLQTSEGPKGTPGKLQVMALPLSQEAADHADAHPAAHPLVCG